jgi:four helix bundle suffix protein
MTNSPGPEDQLGFIPPHGGYDKFGGYLLDQLLHQLEQAFLRDGGFTERLYQARQQARALPPRPKFKRKRTNRTDQTGAQPDPSGRSNALPPRRNPTKPLPPQA